ncbi:MAG: glycosyltransferase [Alloprevotella sp.]|nr:glycosyltransferase [Alloprevotella sp.]
MLISLITVCRNSAVSLRDAFESVLRQTHTEVDYIVVDGASTDATPDLVAEYAPRFGGRMRYLSEPDGGLYYAMNKGLAMARGEVVGILNADDFFTSPTVLERVAVEFAEADTDAVYGDVHFVRDGELGRSVRHYSSRYFRPWMLHCGFMPAHPSFYCRREIYGRYGGFDTWFKVSADYELMVRLFLMHGIRARYVPMDFVTMRIGGASTSGLTSLRAVFHDKYHSLRRNGFHASVLLLCTSYVPKLWGVLRTRFSCGR